MNLISDKSNQLWDQFTSTGKIEDYLMYKSYRKRETTDEKINKEKRNRNHL
ncbi:MAG: hypothetical protein NC090_04040 [Anaeroplasma bactoclasticum]|nr:hypothetical protein [Anaeroplasma bactoclasticum]